MTSKSPNRQGQVSDGDWPRWPWSLCPWNLMWLQYEAFSQKWASLQKRKEQFKDIGILEESRLPKKEKRCREMDGWEQQKQSSPIKIEVTYVFRAFPCVSDTMLNIFQRLSHWILTSLRGRHYYYPYLTDEDAEAERRRAACSRSQR